MTDTTWTSSSTGFPARHGARSPGPIAAKAGLWKRVLAAPLHRALDSALRAGELRDLGPGTLADIGYRRG